MSINVVRTIFRPTLIFLTAILSLWIIQCVQIHSWDFCLCLCKNLLFVFKYLGTIDLTRKKCFRRKYDQKGTEGAGTKRLWNAALILEYSLHVKVCKPRAKHTELDHFDRISKEQSVKFTLRCRICRADRNGPIQCALSFNVFITVETRSQSNLG